MERDWSVTLPVGGLVKRDWSDGGPAEGYWSFGGEVG